MQNPEMFSINKKLQPYVASIVSAARKYLSPIEILELIYIINASVNSELQEAIDPAQLADMIHIMKWEIILHKVKSNNKYFK